MEASADDAPFDFNLKNSSVILRGRPEDFLAARQQSHDFIA